jgi:hypothetical protein
MSNRPFPSSWLGRCKDQQSRDDFKEYLLNCRRLFDELEHLLSREESGLQKQEFDYSDAAWAYKQAHINGMRDMLSRVRQLIP